MRISSIEGDPVQLADWAELELLYSGGTELSLESIRTQLDFEGLLGDDPTDDSDTSDEAAQSPRRGGRPRDPAENRRRRQGLPL